MRKEMMMKELKIVLMMARKIFLDTL